MKLLGDREAALFGGLALGSFGSSQDPGGRTQAAQVHCRWEYLGRKFNGVCGVWDGRSSVAVPRRVIIGFI